MHINKLDGWLKSYYTICCWGVVFFSNWSWSALYPTSILIKTPLLGLSWFNLHSPQSVKALIHLGATSPSSSSIYLPPTYLLTHLLFRFIPTLQYHLSPLWTHIVLCCSQFPAELSPRSHEINTSLCGGCVWVHEAATPPAGEMDKAHHRILQSPNRWQGTSFY